MEAAAVVGAANAGLGEKLEIRMGIATAPCYGGIVGTTVPRFHLFGASVDTAVRIEQNGTPGAILVSSSTFLLSSARYSFERAEGGLIVDEYEIFRLRGRKGAKALANDDAARTREAMSPLSVVEEIVNTAVVPPQRQQQPDSSPPAPSISSAAPLAAGSPSSPHIHAANSSDDQAHYRVQVAESSPGGDESPGTAASMHVVRTGAHLPALLTDSPSSASTPVATAMLVADSPAAAGRAAIAAGPSPAARTLTVASSTAVSHPLSSSVTATASGPPTASSVTEGEDAHSSQVSAALLLRGSRHSSNSSGGRHSSDQRALSNDSPAMQTPSLLTAPTGPQTWAANASSSAHAAVPLSPSVDASPPPPPSHLIVSHEQFVNEGVA
jgi:hypothetical protein